MTDRTLVLLRHAKAERPHGGVADIDRPLSQRGRADAAAAGAWLLTRRLSPALVLCSPSRRTRQTWHAVATALGGDASDVTTRYEPQLYYATDPRELLHLITPTPPEVTVLLVVGHNPLMSTLSELLDPGGGPKDGLRTSGLAVHRLGQPRHPAEGQPWHGCAAGLASLTFEHTARA